MELKEVKIEPIANCLDSEISFKSYKDKLEMVIVRAEKKEMELDVIGIYPGLINALRRILLSEVPTMAIERVTFSSNTSVIQDEVLAHRLGLVPLKADARMFEYHLSGREGTDRDTLHFELKATCEKNPHARFGHKRESDLYTDSRVFSSALKWLPVGEQGRLYKETDIGPVDGDIVIAKLKPGLEIHAKMEAVKGIGRDHAKFSPVGTASYRLLPWIEITDTVEGEDARVLASCFSPGVIGIEDNRAFVRDARIDTTSRNIFYYEHLRDRVKMGLTKDHYIFSIEPVNGARPSDLFKESVKILKQKCVSALTTLEKLSTKKKDNK